MGLQVYNTLSRAKEEFVPLEPGKVSFYVCGVTVYDHCHIGHAWSAIVFDVIYRYLMHLGYEVTYVRNFTDVDDKIIRRAHEEGVDYRTIVDRYVASFQNDMESLGILPLTFEPMATENIPHMIEIIKILMEKGIAYQAGSDVYFEVERFNGYGKLVLAMLFFFSSTRTRGSFEAGMAQLGGHGAFIDSNTTQISHDDTPVEIGEIFGRYFDGIAIRHCDFGDGNRYLNDVAKSSRAPVLNMQCDIYHPFQCLADLMTIMEKKGRDLRKKKIVVSWAYAASYLKPISVPQSLILQMPRFGMDVTLAYPPEFKLMPEIVEQAKEEARKAGAGFEIVDTKDGMPEACRNADLIYAKSWGPLLTTSDKTEGKKIQDSYKDWIMDDAKLKVARPDAIYMHPLPADRDIEVTSKVLDGPNSVVFDEADNRLHAQKAVMALTMF